MFGYRLPEPLPWDLVAGPIAAAEAALARLDECLVASPMAEGWRERNHLAAVCAEALLRGDLVHLEDLVLHEAGMDVRAPTADLTRARAALQFRRRLETCRVTETWHRAEREALGPDADRNDVPRREEGEGRAAETVATGDVELDAALAAVDAAISRVDGTLAGTKRSRLIYDEDRGDRVRRDAWRDLVARTDTMPAVLAAVVIVDGWEALAPVEHREPLGWTLAAAILRSRGTTRFLPSLAIGVRSVPRLRWQARDPMTRLMALLEALSAAAETGRMDHERWLTSRTLLLAKCAGRRRASHLPALVDLVLRTPLVSAGMIAKELRITPRAAQNLVAELGLRELTGRERYRAWGVL